METTENQEFILRDGEIVSIRKAPVQLLIWRLLHANASPQFMQNQRDAAIELDRRRREEDLHLSGYVEAKVVAFISPPCCICAEHGEVGKGIFVVGKKTYCLRHKRFAVHHLSTTRATMCDLKDRMIRPLQHEAENARKANDRLHRHATAMRKRRK